MRSSVTRFAAAVGVSLLAVTPAATAKQSTVDVIGTVVMGPGARLSAAIYDERGQIIRRLYDLAPRAGIVTLTWDGKDDDGYDVPRGKYTWRTISTGAVGSHDGHTGDRGAPLPGEPYERAENPGDTTAVAFGSDGDLYLVSVYEEFQNDVRRIGAADLGTGKNKWPNGDGWKNRGHAIAVDDESVYVAAIAREDKPEGEPENDDEYRIFRRDDKTGAFKDWADPKNILVTKPWAHGKPVVTGLAVDDKYLWVADTGGNQLRVYTKSDGKPAPILGGQSTMPLTAPHAIATDGAGRLWVVTGDRVQRYFYDPAAQNLVPETAITGLDRPYGLAWDLGNKVLYVSEIGTGKIRKYDASGAEQATPWSFSNMPAAGTVTDTSFGWKYDTGSLVPGGTASIAVTPDGKTLAVTDFHNGRTLFYDTKTGAAKPERLEGVNNPNPDVSVAIGANRMTSQSREYEVDYSKPDPAFGHPWRLKANWAPTDISNGDVTVTSSVIRNLNDGNEYGFYFLGQRCNGYGSTNCHGSPGPFPYGGILVYRLNTDGPGQGMKRVAAVQRHTPDGGPTNSQRLYQHLTITTDTNGNGVLGDSGDVSETTDRKGYLNGDPSVWADDNGTIWLANGTTYDTAPHSGVGRIPLSGFDAKGNPQYRLADFTVPPLTEYDADPASGAASPMSRQVMYDKENDRIFAAVDTTEFDQVANYGGNAVKVMDLKTGQKSVISGYSRLNGVRMQPRDSVTGLAVDSSGGFFYTGGNSHEGQRITMHTWDGLPVARAVTPLPAYSPGWLDRGQSLTAFTNTDGTHYAYAEDIGYGTNQRYAFTRVESVHRFGGDFFWPGKPTSNDLVAWWRLDAGRSGAQFVAESSGGNHWGVYQPKPGTRWWQPEGGVHNGALRFDGAGVQHGGVHFGKNSWGGAPDNVADDPANSALTVATWFNTKDSGVLFGYQNAWPREDYTKPTASMPALYVGQDGKLYGGALTAPDCATRQVVSPTAVNDGRWHHAALVATKDGQTLYLDGKPLPGIPCGRVTGGLAFSSLGKGYTASWPSTPGDYFHYTGLLDDVRVYRSALSAGDVGQLATPPTLRGPLAHWTFDEVLGNTARDVTDHGKEAVVTAGSWQPLGGRIGGALSFNGTATHATPPAAMTTVAPVTIGVWVKTTKGGPVLGDQRGPYPTAMVNEEYWATRGVGEPTSAETIGISPADGTVRSYVMSERLGGPGKSPDLRDGQWHHIAVTATLIPDADPTKVPTFSSALYVDGTLIDSGPAQPRSQGIWSSLRPDNQFGAARNADNSWSYYTGLLDDARIYDRVLGPEEIKGLAQR